MSWPIGLGVINLYWKYRYIHWGILSLNKWSCCFSDEDIECLCVLRFVSFWSTFMYDPRHWSQDWPNWIDQPIVTSLTSFTQFWYTIVPVGNPTNYVLVRRRILRSPCGNSTNRNLQIFSEFWNAQMQCTNGGYTIVDSKIFVIFVTLNWVFRFLISQISVKDSFWFIR